MFLRIFDKSINLFSSAVNRSKLDYKANSPSLIGILSEVFENYSAVSLNFEFLSFFITDKKLSVRVLLKVIVLLFLDSNFSWIGLNKLIIYLSWKIVESYADLLYRCLIPWNWLILLSLYGLDLYSDLFFVYIGHKLSISWILDFDDFAEKILSCSICY